MYDNVLGSKQKELLPIIAKFSNMFGLIGGTAVALQIGHRSSIDFDLFTNNEFDNQDIVKIISAIKPIQSTIADELDQLSVVINDVKVTFLRYPFNLELTQKYKEIISLPDLVYLGAMKAYTLGRRSKWKDYVDLYYIFKKHSISEICKKAEEIYKGNFNSKLFREQLCYFEDIDFTEPVNFISEPAVLDSEIQKSLKETSLIL